MSDDDLQISHADDGDEGGFYLRRDGEKLGEMTYRRAGGDVLEFHHTWLDESLRGQGQAGRLLDHAMRWVREQGAKVEPTCPYVKSQFEKDESLADLRAS